MMHNREQKDKKRKILTWAESLLLSFLPLLFIYVKCGVYFEMNDDRMINEILTGVLTGSPDGHAIFLNYLLGGFLAFLYSVADNIPWFGLLLIGSHLAVYCCFFGILLERCRGIYQHVLGIVCGLFLIYSNLYIFGEIQYTSTAALLAAGGYFSLIFDKSRYRRFALFGFFQILALLLRSQAMLMVQIPGMCILLITGFTQCLYKEKELRCLFRELLVTVGIIIAGLGISWVGNYIIGDYGLDAWQEYAYFRQIRGDMSDYYGFPAYESVSDILDKYQVSETEYIAFTRYWMLGNVLDISCLEELHAVAEQNYQASRSNFGILVKELSRSRFQGGIMGYGKYTLMLYAFCMLLVFAQRRWSVLMQLVALNIGRNIALGYLLYRGRLPFRVLSGLYFVEMIFLLALLFELLQTLYHQKRWIQLGAAIVAIAVIVISVDTMKDTYNGLYWQHQGRKAYSSGMYDIMEHCTNSDAGYLMVEMATTYYTGNVLNMDWYRNRNYLSCGFWWSASPHISEYQQKYIEEHQGNLRVVEMGPGMDPGQSFVVDLFTKEYGLELNLTEEMTLSNGIVLLVYNVQGDFQLKD